MCRRFALSILTAVPLAFAAGHAGAADIYVVGAGAIQEPFEALTAEFSRETGNKVHAIFGPVGGMQAKLKGGERADVIVLSTAAMDALDKAGSLVAGTRADLGRAVAGIGVKTGAPQPDISTPDALKKTLQAAVANGAAEIGISFTSELLPNKGVKVVGPMPQSIGLVVTYVAGAATASTQAEAARALIAYMTRPAARDRFKEAGL